MDISDLSGKSALITGATSGIGRALAFELSRLGARLFICGSNAERIEGAAAELRATGATVYAQRVDVSDRAQFESFAAAVHQEVEAVDILINNAGTALLAKFEDTSLEDWEWILGVNLWGVIHGLQLFVPPMMRRGAGGHIVNVSSGQGFAGARFSAAYATSKFAVAGLAEVLRLELAPHNIGVTAAFPGMVKTNIVHQFRRRGIFQDEELMKRFSAFFAERGEEVDPVMRSILRGVSRNQGIALSASSRPIYHIKRLCPSLVPKLFAHVEHKVFGTLID